MTKINMQCGIIYFMMVKLTPKQIYQIPISIILQNPSFTVQDIVNSKFKWPPNLRTLLECRKRNIFSLLFLLFCRCILYNRSNTGHYIVFSLFSKKTHCYTKEGFFQYRLLHPLFPNVILPSTYYEKPKKLWFF